MDATTNQFVDTGPLNSLAALTEEARAGLADRLVDAEKDLADRQVARYKLEVQLASHYTTLKPSAGIVSFWESGTKLHGGGDTKIYVCPGRSLGRNDCEAIIPDPSHGYGYAVCPACQTAWKGTDVHGEFAYRLSSNGWAEVLLKWFVRLGLNSDLRIKYPPDDIRSLALAEQAQQKRGSVLAGGRTRRAVRIYTMGAIITDTSAGADLYSRILAFIKA